jgi:imidazolonepropionase-like amidohydrolase
MTQTRTKYHAVILALALASLAELIAGCSAPTPESASTPAASSATAFTGARLIVGDGQVIENATLVVDNGRFAAVGAGADVNVPQGAARVDLSGKTLMPALLDAHVHTSSTPQALIRDLEQRAALGVAAVLSLGWDADDALLALRDDPTTAGRFRSAGRGITAPEPGRSEAPHWVTTEEEARQAVRDEAARNVDIIKIWVDDRDGKYPKLSPELYTAVIEEAHQHGLRVAAHIFTLEDAKGVLRAGIDVFAHGVRDRDIDDEFVELVRQRPNVVLIPNLPARGVPTDLAWLEGVMAPEQLATLQAANVDQPEVKEAYGIQARNLARLAAAGMTVAMGTDGNSYWAPHIEMEDMVAAGLSPAEVLIAATRNSARVLGLTEAGTVETGKSADFIVLEANPLDDITNTRRIADVYVRGMRVERTL